MIIIKIVSRQHAFCVPFLQIESSNYACLPSTFITWVIWIWIIQGQALFSNWFSSTTLVELMQLRECILIFTLGFAGNNTSEIVGTRVAQILGTAKLCWEHDPGMQIVETKIGL